MTDSTYTGSYQALENKLGPILSEPYLANLLNSLTPDASGNLTIGLTNGSSNFKFDASEISAAIVNGSVKNIDDLQNAAKNSSGGYDDLGTLATYITNDGSTAIPVVASDSAFVELQGPATVEGASAPVFVVDASHDTSNVSLDASTGYSFLLGGSGSDTLTGSTSSSGVAVLHAGSGPTTMTGGLGMDSLYGGGNTTMTGGSGAGQILEDFTSGAHDSISAGTGGGEMLAVASGSSTLDDTNGFNDTLVAGSGSDTLIGSASGTLDQLFGGSTSIVSNGSDTVAASAATTASTVSIDATKGMDQVSFAGESSDQLDALVAASKPVNGVTTIQFTNSNNVVQTVKLTDVSHITFK